MSLRRDGRAVITQKAASSSTCFLRAGTGVRKDRGFKMVQRIDPSEGSSVMKTNFQINTFHMLAFYFFFIWKKCRMPSSQPLCV